MASNVKRIQKFTRGVIGKGTGPGKWAKSNGYWSQRRRKNTADLLRMGRKLQRTDGHTPFRKRYDYNRIVKGIDIYKKGGK